MRFIKKISSRLIEKHMERFR